MSWIWPDIHDEKTALRATRPAFWASLVVAVLYLFSSTLGVVFSLPFLAIAVGIRAKRLGAATAGLACVGVMCIHALYVAFAVTELEIRLAFALVPLLWGPVAYFYLRALCGLMRYHRTESGERHASNLLPLRWGLIPLGLVLIRLPIFVSLFVIPTGAMENTLLIGDHIVAERISGWLGTPPRRGDIVIVRYPVDPTQTFIKRVVGVPGDRLRLVNKELQIDGLTMVEPYTIHKSDFVEFYRDNFPSEPDGQIYPQAEEMLEQNVLGDDLLIPAGSYFVLGDNRDHSLDSRYWGFIEQGDILGSPLFVYWSAAGIPREGDDFEEGDIRWERIYKRIRPYDLGPATN